jgi:hypothetical protein
VLATLEILGHLQMLARSSVDRDAIEAAAKAQTARSRRSIGIN